MSRSRRNRGAQTGDTLGNLENNDLPYPGADLQEMSTTEFASAGYGSRIADFESVGRGKVTARPVDIDKIYPDPSQPRRTIPSVLRQYWNGQPDHASMALLWMMWLKEIELERGGQPPDVDAILNGEVSGRSLLDETEDEHHAEEKHKPGKLETALLKIAELAASIKRDGLLNPIGVVPGGSTFMIETGERRWLAYHLLRWRFPGETTWLKIPAREVESINIWRQAGENNARADLNAIARARQLALLLMDIYSKDEGVEFAPFSEFERENEQDYYAQVADGTVFKIPPQKMELFLNAMGFSHPVQIRQYRSLLRLPGEVWTLADDLNWTQSAIEKDLLQPSEGDRDTLIYLAYQKAGLQPERRVSILTLDSPESDDAETENMSRTSGAGITSGFKRWQKRIKALRVELDTMLSQEREVILEELEALVEELRSRR